MLIEAGGTNSDEESPDEMEDNEEELYSGAKKEGQEKPSI